MGPELVDLRNVGRRDRDAPSIPVYILWKAAMLHQCRPVYMFESSPEKYALDEFN